MHASDADTYFAHAIRAWEYGDGHTAKIYFYKLAKMGDRRGFSGLGMLDAHWSEFERIVEWDRKKLWKKDRIKYEEALQYFQKAADMGDGLGFFGLGWMSMMGRGVPQDETKALEYFQKARQIWEKEAQEGSVEAYVFLGRLYSGEIHYCSPLRDSKKSVAYFKKAMEMGDPRGYFELGEFYNQKERDTRANKKLQAAREYGEKAHAYYQKAAQLGYAIAYYRLKKFANNSQEISEYLQKSADMGYWGACFDVGWYAYQDQDIQKALKYFNKACTMGDYISCNHVGEITGKNPAEPGFWDWLRDLF
ncbi:tetratricopeptide repeat protein [Helicobacter labacensis]|uniref:tetratricopeptide repeat protein n=1 Tax=Helicobacter labacensis TaxID=2316079 RepID=UPI001F46EA45|nr:tetratricopeptide repeat protein [Helicobacter labacensis]